MHSSIRIIAANCMRIWLSTFSTTGKKREPCESAKT